nr:M protein, serotype 2.1-like [Procambarus clarkii]
MSGDCPITCIPDTKSILSLNFNVKPTPFLVTRPTRPAQRWYELAIGLKLQCYHRRQLPGASPNTTLRESEQFSQNVSKHSVDSENSIHEATELPCLEGEPKGEAETKVEAELKAEAESETLNQNSGSPNDKEKAIISFNRRIEAQLQIEEVRRHQAEHQTIQAEQQIKQLEIQQSIAINNNRLEEQRIAAGQASKSDRRDLTASKSDRRDLTASKSDRRDLTASKTDRRDLAASKSDRRDITASKSVRRDLTASNSDRRDLTQAGTLSTPRVRRRLETR